jgi:IclR family transcriptional regulator, KDG regulon repressor
MDSAQKVIKLLEVFLGNAEEIGIADLSTKSGLSLSTTHRLVSSLVKEGYLHQAYKRGKYSLGLKLLEYSRIILDKLQVTEVAKPFLHELNDMTGETINIGVLDGKQSVQITRIESNHVLRIFTSIGKRGPLYCTSTGKVLLANLPKEELTKYLDSEHLQRQTEKTITSIQALEKELSAVREQGVGIDDEESNMGVRSVAAPIRDWSGKVIAAVAVVAPVLRLDDIRIIELKHLLRTFGMKISRAMGYAERA